ncbi:MAG: flagellar biosynthesis protein FlhF [Geobacteraceae bacterium]|jgi:flagellar biosynthesis protein FlhF
MLVKKFQAVSMPEALKMVKAEFGLDAMILNSREERRKGIMGLFRKPYIEVTAAMGTPSPGRGVNEPAPEEVRSNTREEFRNAMLEPLAREIKLLKDKVETLFERESGTEKALRLPLAQVCGESGGDPVPEFAGDVKPDGFEKVQWQSGEMQLSLPAPAPEVSPPECGRKGMAGSKAALNVFVEELRQNGVDPEFAQTLADKIIPLIGRKRKPDALRKGLKQALESIMDFTGLATGKGCRRVVALIGPTGVGKTTTIAKIAAKAAEEGKRVAIITTDNLRPGTDEYLKRHAGSSEVVIDAATTPRMLAKAVKKHQDRDIILIDTAGVSPKDRDAMERLQALLTACPGSEKHLCLSSTTRDRELAETVGRFAGHSIDRLIFTRLDESETFGSIINVLLRSNLPPAYLTTGQRVPQDLEIATADRLSELAMGVM